MKKIILLFILLIVLYGCAESTYLNKYPKNIKYLNEALTWDHIDGAIGYRLMFDEDNIYEVTGNYFDASIIKNGTYEVTIQTILDPTDSNYSPVYSFTIDRVYPTINHIEITGSILTWTNIPSAVSYTIYAGDKQVSSNTNYILLYDLYLDEFETYDLYVVAVFRSGDTSSPSATVRYTT